MFQSQRKKNHRWFVLPVANEPASPLGLRTESVISLVLSSIRRL